MTKIAFTADLHVDDLGNAINPATGLNRRFEDALEIVRWIAGDAQERGCDVLILGGDFTEQRHPAPWRVGMIRDALSLFGRRKVLVRGNHDGQRAGRSIVDVLATALPEAKGFDRPGIAWVEQTAICAIPYLSRSWMRTQPGFEAVPDADVYRELGEQFLAIARGLYADAAAQGANHAVLVVHQGLSGGNMTDEQQAFLGDLDLVVDSHQLASIGFDAVLAGHFHLHQALFMHPPVLYAGSPNRVSFQEEHQAKGYVVFDTDQPDTFEFIETPARRFVTLNDADIGDYPDVEDAIVRVRDVHTNVDVALVRRELEDAGAFEVTSISVRPAEATAPSRGLGEGISPRDALEQYFVGDPDAAALVAIGAEILEAVRS